MSAPSYNLAEPSPMSSSKATNGKAPLNGPAHDDDLHRYVTEDQPMTAKMQPSGLQKSTNGLFVCVCAGKDANSWLICEKTVQPLRRNE